MDKTIKANKNEEKKFHISHKKLCQDINCKGNCLNVHLKPPVLERQPKYNIEKDKN